MQPELAPIPNIGLVDCQSAGVVINKQDNLLARVESLPAGGGSFLDYLEG